jgi:hypothetical protein
VSGTPLARLALLAALLAGLFFACFERSSEPVYTGLRGEAARNPYLAAETLLDALGLPVTRVARIAELDALPPVDATLILTGQRVRLSAERSAQLVDWVARGGHLVVQIWTLWDDPKRAPDPILDPLGVRQYQRPTSSRAEGEASGAEGEDAAEPPAGEASAATEAGMNEVAEWISEPGAQPLRLRFDPRYSLELEEHTASWRVADRAGTHGLSVPHGAGHITVWTDDRFLTNEAIDELDHAAATYRLVRLFGHGGATWIVRGNGEPPDLWARFWREAWPLAVALGALLGFHVWTHAPRFGPVQPDPPLERRELMEHVEAAGQFLARHRGAHSLVGAVRAALFRKLQTRHPQWTRLAPAAQAERVAEWTGIPLAEVASALAAEPARAPGAAAPELAATDFTFLVATLEAIRRKL